MHASDHQRPDANLVECLHRTMQQAAAPEGHLPCVTNPDDERLLRGIINPNHPPDARERDALDLRFAREPAVVATLLAWLRDSPDPNILYLAAIALNGRAEARAGLTQALGDPRFPSQVLPAVLVSLGRAQSPDEQRAMLKLLCNRETAPVVRGLATEGLSKTIGDDVLAEPLVEVLLNKEAAERALPLPQFKNPFLRWLSERITSLLEDNSQTPDTLVEDLRLGYATALTGTTAPRGIGALAAIVLDTSRSLKLREKCFEALLESQSPVAAAALQGMLCTVTSLNALEFLPAVCARLSACPPRTATAAATFSLLLCSVDTPMCWGAYTLRRIAECLSKIRPLSAEEQLQVDMKLRQRSWN